MPYFIKILQESGLLIWILLFIQYIKRSKTSHLKTNVQWYQLSNYHASYVSQTLAKIFTNTYVYKIVIGWTYFCVIGLVIGS